MIPNELINSIVHSVISKFHNLQYLCWNCCRLVHDRFYSLLFICKTLANKSWALDGIKSREPGLEVRRNISVKSVRNSVGITETSKAFT